LYLKAKSCFCPERGEGQNVTNQKQIVEALLNPEAYEEPQESIELVQTHISFVFLTQRFVYKVKKAVDFGFLDFTTLEKRRFFCEKELEINRRLCGDLYLEVVPINKSVSIRIKGEGETVEYAVKMRRIPQEMMLSRLLENGKVDKKLVDEIARIVAKFHSRPDTKGRISGFRRDPIVETNWAENFVQTVEFVDNTISRGEFDFIKKRIEDFIKLNASVFGRRMAEGRVRECHGDIHSGNIFVADRIYIFDAVEFNDRMSYSDVTADIAFLAMDLDFKGRTDLSDHLVERYVAYSGDQEVPKLLPFYKCYRAYVRGKVVSFRLNDASISTEEKTLAAKEAKQYFTLSLEYAKTL
jgi:hypothetical protein